MTANYSYAYRMRLPVVHCVCLAPITREGYVANRQQPAHVGVYDAETGHPHHCPPPQIQEPPRSSYWDDWTVPEEELHGVSPPPTTPRRRTSQRFESIEVD